MKWKEFFNHNRKKMLIVLVIIGVGYFFVIFGTNLNGFKSGAEAYGVIKNCTCLGIPINSPGGFGGISHHYCIGIVSNCHCYLKNDYLYYLQFGHFSNETDISFKYTEVDCNCPEGKYTKDFPKEHVDYCNVFRSW
jgi:hypothetical protein